MRVGCLILHFSEEYEFDNKKAHSCSRTFFDLALYHLAPKKCVLLEMICNRFASAKFQTESLLRDIKELIEFPVEQGYDLSIETFLDQYFRTELDFRTANRILNGHLRFNFGNALIWNSFLAELETNLKIQLKVSREAVSAVMMAYSISLDPKLAKEVAPSVPENAILFILEHFSPDENMPMRVDLQIFMESMSVDQESSFHPIQPPKSVFEMISENFKFYSNDWSKVQVDSFSLSQFPFLLGYVYVG